MGWSIQDSCDVVKINENRDILEERYNTIANHNRTMGDWRDMQIETYPGPGSPKIHPSMQTNGFTQYANYGGTNRQE